MSESLKLELIRRAEKAGIEVDKRWGVERLEQALSDAAMADAPEPSLADHIDDGLVACRVTKFAQGKIATGKEDPTHFKWGEVVHFPRETAQQLEDRHFVEIGAPDE